MLCVWPCGAGRGRSAAGEKPAGFIHSLPLEPDVLQTNPSMIALFSHLY